jgi:uncharacterized membrane protein YeaQ/YmgE (transglycosylase-associated protein family)
MTAIIVWLIVVVLLAWLVIALLGSLSSVVSFLLVGGIAGWLAGKFMRGRGFGIFKNILVGIVGAFVGGILFGLAGFRTAGLVASLITATVGAVVFLYMVRWLRAPSKSA